jgi:FlaA1/EpsC-like NDP-sugar epimerase
LDIYENNAYDIEQELKRKHKDLELITLIASVRDMTKMRDVFEKYRPSIVFHAAAHKHVPLMETSPNEAVKNNVFGTLNVAKCADEFGVETFVQISTDKAVNPTNIMGATKRICEMIIQTIGKHSKKTKFVAVRFGNVLGSNGSVIPLFKKQIAEGGPVTVTHKDIIRYFMTIPEAVSLVLQAGAYAKGGQIFVLDMGEPVRIYDLAYNLIKFSGLEPNVDINIVCTGLRPGEKLYEERLMAEEGLQKTPNGLINIAKPIELDETEFWATLDKLFKAALDENETVVELVKRLVPSYKIDQTSEAKDFLKGNLENITQATIA